MIGLFTSVHRLRRAERIVVTSVPLTSKSQQPPDTRHEEHSSHRADAGHSLRPPAACTWKRDAPGPASAATRTGSVARSTRRAGRADCPLSGSAIEPDTRGLDLPARTCSSLAVAPAEPRAGGRCAHASGATTELGPERAGARGVPGPHPALEPGRHLDDKPWQRLSRSAARRHGCGPAYAAQS